jgi:hypothetical protein
MEFCMTRVASINHLCSFFYDSHTLYLHIVATSLKRHFKKKKRKKKLPQLEFEPQTCHTLNEHATPAPR